MKSTSLGTLLVPLALTLGAALGQTQVTLTLDDLPQTIGASQQLYYESSVSGVRPLIAGKGGPQRWDFSRPQGPNEDIHTVNIVPPGDGGHGSAFPTAAYAERLTRQSSGLAAWSYYRIAAGQGRAYYGFYDAVSNPANPLKVFEQPTVDLAAAIRYGQNWSRSVDFEDMLEVMGLQLTVAVHFTCSAEVDAFGTLVLPDLGAVPALRVMELQVYQSTDLTFGLPLGTQYIRIYYWLAKGLGKAAEIVSTAGTTVPPRDFDTAEVVLRVFASSGFLRPVRGLKAVLQNKDLLLWWDVEPTAASYHLQTVNQLSPQPEWTLLSATTNNSWSAPLAGEPPQRFFRAFWSE